MLIKGKLWPCRYDSKHKHHFRDSGGANTSGRLRCRRPPCSSLTVGSALSLRSRFVFSSLKPLWVVSLRAVCADLYSSFIGILIRNVASFCSLTQKELIKTVSLRDELLLMLLWSLGLKTISVFPPSLRNFLYYTEEILECPATKSTLHCYSHKFCV